MFPGVPGQLQAVRAMPLQARRAQLIGVRDLRHRLAGGEAAVDFRTLQVLTCLARSHSRNVGGKDLGLVNKP
jgi:hypothetical protein